MTKKAEHTKVLWTAETASQATGGRTDSAWTVSGVSIDSRNVAKGDLFIALRGPNFDGHKFVAQALENGASAALVDHVPDGLDQGAPLLVTANTEKALFDLGAAARNRTSAKIIGVTGSVGKTGVKEVLRSVLSQLGACSATEGNLNNHLGLPLSLARMAQDTDFGVFEMGMNHLGELTPLSRACRPDVAVITTVEAVHAGNFDSEEAIADAKAEIFAGMEKNSVAVLNADNRHFDRLRKAAKTAGIGKVIAFGSSDEADITVVSSETDADGSNVTAAINGKTVSYRIALPGTHWVVNSLAVLGVVAALNLDVAAAARSLSQVSPLKGRGERFEIALPDGGSFTLLDDSYNASPASMRAAFETLSRIEPGQGGHRIAILGDMLELGPASAEHHAGLATPLEEAKIHMVLTVGRAMAHLRDALTPAMRGGHESAADAMVPLAINRIRKGDVVLVKGSAGSRMGVIVEALKTIETAPRVAANGG